MLFKQSHILSVLAFVSTSVTALQIPWETPVVIASQVYLNDQCTIYTLRQDYQDSDPHTVEVQTYTDVDPAAFILSQIPGQEYFSIRDTNNIAYKWKMSNDFFTISNQYSSEISSPDEVWTLQNDYGQNDFSLTNYFNQKQLNHTAITDISGYYDGADYGSQFKFYTVPQDQNWTISFEILSNQAQMRKLKTSRVVHEFFVNNLTDDQVFLLNDYLIMNISANLTYDKFDVSPYDNTSYTVPWPKLFFNGSDWAVGNFSVWDQNVTWSEPCGLFNQSFRATQVFKYKKYVYVKTNETIIASGNITEYRVKVPYIISISHSSGYRYQKLLNFTFTQYDNLTFNYTKFEDGRYKRNCSWKNYEYVCCDQWNNCYVEKENCTQINNFTKYCCNKTDCEIIANNVTFCEQKDLYTYECCNASGCYNSSADSKCQWNGWNYWCCDQNGFCHSKDNCTQVDLFNQQCCNETYCYNINSYVCQNITNCTSQCCNGTDCYNQTTGNCSDQCYWQGFNYTCCDSEGNCNSTQNCTIYDQFTDYCCNDTACGFVANNLTVCNWTDFYTYECCSNSRGCWNASAQNETNCTWNDFNYTCCDAYGNCNTTNNCTYLNNYTINCCNDTSCQNITNFICEDIDLFTTECCNGTYCYQNKTDYNKTCFMNYNQEIQCCDDYGCEQEPINCTYSGFEYNYTCCKEDLNSNCYNFTNCTFDYPNGWHMCCNPNGCQYDRINSALTDVSYKSSGAGPATTMCGCNKAIDLYTCCDWRGICTNTGPCPKSQKQESKKGFNLHFLKQE